MKLKFYVGIALLLTFSLVACSAARLSTSAPAAQDSTGFENEGQTVPQEAPVEAMSPGQAPAAPMEAPAAAATSAPANDLASSYPGSGSGASGLIDISSGSGRMVIKDALIDLIVKDTDRAVDDVTELAATQGGYIISGRTWFDGDLKYANIRMGVPSANFERTLTFLRALGFKVVNETASGQDVSAEYNDLGTRLANLEATAARVRAFLDEAKTVEESLRINQTLTDLEGQINQIKGQMKFYEGRSAFSTIEVNLSPLAPTPTPTLTPTQTPTPTPTPSWKPGATIKEASQRGVVVWQNIVDGLIWVFFLFWPLVLVAVLIVLLIRWLRGRKAKKTPSASNQQPPSQPPPQA